MLKLRRYKNNPILKPNPKNWWESVAVFNPGALLKNGKIYLLYRAIGEYEQYISRLGLAVSDDGFIFERVSKNPVFAPERLYDQWACEDPRITELEGKIYITYVALLKPARSKGQTSLTALLSTKDFRNFRRLGVLTSRQIDDRDTVLFPEKIKGRYVILHRPQEYIGADYREWKSGGPPSIWIVFSDEIRRWDIGQVLMRPQEDWEAKKIGASPPPLKTSKGWLLIYHGVDDKHVYRAGIALLALENPSRVIARLPYSVLEPEKDYEKKGDVPNVVFPEGVIIKDGILFVYYGGADKVCCLATVKLASVLKELKKFT